MATDLGEQIITAAMSNTIDPETADRLLDIHLRVCRQIICPVTGQVLDSGTGHLLTVASSEGTTDQVVIAPDVSDDVITERFAGHDLTVVSRFDPAPAWKGLLKR